MLVEHHNIKKKMADKENSPPPGGTLVNYIYRCGTWWEVGKLTYMVAALPREKSPVFFLSGVDRYAYACS